jgi:hypothetical protein
MAVLVATRQKKQVAGSTDPEEKAKKNG